MRWVGHVARVGSIEMHAVVWWESQMDPVRLKDLSIDGIIILKLS